MNNFAVIWSAGIIAQNEITEKLSALLLRAIRYTIPDYLLENCVSRRL